MMELDGVNISKAQWNGGGARLYRGDARLDEVSVIKFKWWRYIYFSKAQWRGC